MLATAYWSRRPAPQTPLIGTSLPRPQPSDASLTAVPTREVTKRTEPKRSRGNGLSAITDRLLKKFDPTEDGWDTEILSNLANRQLEKLAELIGHPETMASEHLSELVTDDFSCQSLRPEPLDQVFQDGIMSIQRWKSGPLLTTSHSEVNHHGGEGLRAAIEQLAQAIGLDGEFHSTMKLYRIATSEDSFTTRNFFDASRHSDQSGVQQSATWICEWTYPTDATSQPPRLMRIDIEAYEEASVRAPRGRLFVDCTEAVMGANASYHEQIRMPLNQWLTRISTLSGMAFFGFHGVTVGDVNGDGLDDIYVCDTGGLPNRLYVQNLDGTLADVSEQSGVDWLTHSVTSLLVDLDSDGDQDLAVATNPLLLLAENDGRGQFTPRVGLYTGMESRSICAADYDQDGDLDIYVCVYSPSSISHVLPIPLPYQDANNGGTNMLFRNEGDFQFLNATAQTGLDANNTRYSLAAAWEDYDNDGDVDLYVANDYGRNNLYRNDAGRFTDVAAEAQVEDIASGMSVTWGDYNRDGWMDVYVSNMFTAAGGRVAFHRQFTGTPSAPGTAPKPMVTQLQRMTRGNSLFANVGDQTFNDVSENEAVAMGRWAWSSRFADLNNDGWQDLVVANGFVTADDTEDL